MFGIKEFIIKKVSQVNVFKNKIDLNQYPGKKFWIKILNETKNKLIMFQIKKL